jgi:hypothetical protein
MSECYSDSRLGCPRFLLMQVSFIRVFQRAKVKVTRLGFIFVGKDRAFFAKVIYKFGNKICKKRTLWLFCLKTLEKRSFFYEK